MSIHFNPNSATPTSGMRLSLPIDHQNAPRPTNFSGSSSLSSLAQEGGEDVGAEEAAKSKPSTDEPSSSVGCWDIVTAPFRAVAYLVNSLWTCLCGKSETVKPTAEDEVPVKPARPVASEFDRALRGRGDAAVEGEELGEIFQRLPASQKRRTDDFLWFLSEKDEPRKAFERRVEDLSEQDRRGLLAARGAHSKLEKFVSYVKAQKIKDLPDDDQPLARTNARKRFDQLAGRDDVVGELAKHELVKAVLILRGRPVPEEELSRVEQHHVLDDFGALVKTAIECLVHNNMMLLGTQKARDSIRDFVQAVSSDDEVTADRVKQQYRRLDPEAAKLLSLAISHAKNQPDNKALVSDCVPADVQLVLRTAFLISSHDNGTANCGLAARREDPRVRGNRGADRDPPDRVVDMGFAAS